jgi:hypothetical protein
MGLRQQKTSDDGRKGRSDAVVVRLYQRNSKMDADQLLAFNGRAELIF